jgi:hypothetical protein
MDTNDHYTSDRGIEARANLKLMRFLFQGIPSFENADKAVYSSDKFTAQTKGLLD